jgi:hypothetical protein
MGRKKGEMTEAEKGLDADVLRVAQDINFDGRAFATLAKALNDAKLKTITKKAWTEDNAARHWKRHKLSVSHIPTKQDTTPPVPPQEPQAPSLADTHNVTQDELTKEAGQVLQGNIQQDPFPAITTLEGLTPTHMVTQGVDAGNDAAPQEGLALDDSEGQAQDTQDAQDSETQEVLQGTPVVLQQGDMNDLVSMLNWWRNERMNAAQAQAMDISVRPDFLRQETVTKTIRLSTAMVEAAERKAKTQKALTGGNFSGLVELLLWRYLGSSKDYLQREDS